MSSLFLSYSGRLLEVTAECDARMAEWFPEVDRQSEYREIDSWLYHAPPRKRPKNIRRFLRNWFLKTKRAQARQAMKDEDIRRELRAGENNYGRSGGV
jgi:hypothetical protein